MAPLHPAGSRGCKRREKGRFLPGLIQHAARSADNGRPPALVLLGSQKGWGFRVQVEVGVSKYWGVPYVGVLIARIILFWGTILGSPIFGISRVKSSGLRRFRSFRDCDSKPAKGFEAGKHGLLGRFGGLRWACGNNNHSNRQQQCCRPVNTTTTQPTPHFYPGADAE